MLPLLVSSLIVGVAFSFSSTNEYQPINDVESKYFIHDFNSLNFPVAIGYCAPNTFQDEHGSIIYNCINETYVLGDFYAGVKDCSNTVSAYQPYHLADQSYGEAGYFNCDNSSVAGYVWIDFTLGAMNDGSTHDCISGVTSLYAALGTDSCAHLTNYNETAPDMGLSLYCDVSTLDVALQYWTFFQDTFNPMTAYFGTSFHGGCHTYRVFNTSGQGILEGVFPINMTANTNGTFQDNSYYGNFKNAEADITCKWLFNFDVYGIYGTIRGCGNGATTNSHTLTPAPTAMPTASGSIMTCTLALVLAFVTMLY
jgi:hypothetical protein